MNETQTLTEGRAALESLIAACRPSGDLHAALPSFARLIRADAIKTLVGLDALLEMSGELEAIACLDDVYTLAPAAAESGAA